MGYNIPSKFYFKHFSLNGAGVDFDMAQLWATETAFQVIPTVNVRIERVNVWLVNASMTPVKFAGLTALTNGVSVKVLDVDDTELMDFTDGQPIKFDAGWGKLSGADSIIYPAAGDDALPIRWTISRAGAQLHLSPGQKLTMLLNDDLSGITHFGAMAQGVIW